MNAYTYVCKNIIFQNFAYVECLFTLAGAAGYFYVEADTG